MASAGERSAGPAGYIHLMMPAATGEVPVRVGGREATVPARGVGDEELWLRAADLPAAVGWEIKPEGVCAADVCVPLDARLEGELIRRRDGETWINLARFARHAGQPFARSENGSVWSFGAPAHEWQRWRGGERAPDFALPDRTGRTRSLAEFAGKKVFLLTWASW